MTLHTECCEGVKKVIDRGDDNVYESSEKL